jgi:hypothetical protein
MLVDVIIDETVDENTIRGHRIEHEVDGEQTKLGNGNCVL